MSRRDAPVTEAMLHAYVDGQLPEPDTSAVEAYLAENPAEAERVEAYRRQNAALQALGTELMARPFQVRLRPRRRLRTGALAAAALLAVALLGGVAGWWLHVARPGLVPGLEAPPRFVQEAAAAHRTYLPEVLHAVEVPASQEQHLVTWLTKRLGRPVRAPQLQEQGFSLMGGRLLPAADRPAAHFMYENEQGQRISLYVLTAADRSRPTAFRYVERGGVSVFYWLDAEMGYALAAELPREALLGVATRVYRQLQDL